MKQIRNLITTILFATLLVSCNQNPNKNLKYDLVVEIEGLGNDTISIEYAPISKFFLRSEHVNDTVYSSNNKFVYDAPIKEPVLAYIIPKKSIFKRKNGSPFYSRHQAIVLIIKPNEKIKVVGKLHKYYIEYKVTGSDLNRDYSKIREGYIAKTSQASKIELQIDSLMYNNGDKKLVNKLFKLRNETNSFAAKKELIFIKNNWNKDLSGFLLAKQRGNVLAKYYNNLSNEVRNGIFKNMLDHKYQNFIKQNKTREASKIIVKNKIAPDFTLKSLDGSDFKLSSIKDKYIVLDFWGTWCGWCIKEFPKIKTYYNKYKSEIEIVGIACKESEKNWKTCIKKNKLDWVHVINSDDINHDVSVMYGISGFPTKFILDKNKKILGKYIGASDAFFKKLDELMKN